MTDWIQTVEVDPTQAMVDFVNGYRSPTKILVEPIRVEPGRYVAPCLVVFRRPISESERDALKARIIALADEIERGLIVDLQLGRKLDEPNAPPRTGFCVPACEGHEFKAYLILHGKLEPSKGD